MPTMASVASENIPAVPITSVHSTLIAAKMQKIAAMVSMGFDRIGAAAPFQQMAAGQGQAPARQGAIPRRMQDDFRRALTDFVELLHLRASSSKPPIPRGRMIRTVMMKTKVANST